MRRWICTGVVMTVLIASCATDDKRGTIAELESENVELKDVDIAGGLDKAMQGYQKFLADTPESNLTPEAIRRLADLKVEKEYGTVTDGDIKDKEEAAATEKQDNIANKSLGSTSPTVTIGDAVAGKNGLETATKDQKQVKNGTDKVTSQQSQIEKAKEPIVLPNGEAGADLQNAGAEEAIELYKKLLAKYPMYERNDQVLYQLSRAYEETGQVDEAMSIMNRLVKQFPHSRYNDEVHFRRGEYYFTRKKYLDAEEAYGEVLKLGVGTVYYDRALYKRGWTFYKQELYEEALKEFFSLLDYKVSIGYDFDQTSDDIERKRIADTFRVVSLSFSNLGGSETVQEFFKKNGSRKYEHNVYKELAEFYFAKRRYNDAALTYNTFIQSNPFHKRSPYFSMRVIEIYIKGQFPKLVIEAKKQYALTYGLKSDYWKYFNQAEFSEVLGFLKANLTDLANHYHSLYQNDKYKKDKPSNFGEAEHWYREFLNSFPRDVQSPAINYQLADLLLENKDFKLAAIEYEHSAYDYPVNDKSEKSAYAAVYAYREYLKTAPASQMRDVKREIIRISLRLVDTYPQHEKATVVLGAATDDLFEMRDYSLAIKTGHRLINEYPAADVKIRRGAWLVIAHSSFEIEIYSDAETAYSEVLTLTPEVDKSRPELIENLAASIYKQGEQSRAAENYKEAVRHFLRIADVAPSSKIRPTAEYDAAAVLIQIMDLEQAVKVLLAFRENYPGHELQKDVTKKIAFTYKELEKYTLAAQEYERVATEADQEDLIREAMLQAAELYEKAKNDSNALRVYQKFVVMFPKPLEFALETYFKIALLYKSQDDLKNYRDTLQHIIHSDSTAGDERTDRTRYLAAQSSLVIIEPQYDEFIAIKLVKPFKKSLTKKQKVMKTLVTSYTKLVDYGVADVTAASTFYIAEIYYNFSRSLMESEKPENLSDVELEEFNTMVEEQAFPFEEKAIKVHEKNIELLRVGVYSNWIDRSIDKLAKLIPARYAKPEESTSYISKIDNFIYSSPRFIREDESTGFVEKLDFFRYASQYLQDKYHKNQEKGDIGSSQGVDLDADAVATTKESLKESQPVEIKVPPSVENDSQPELVSPESKPVSSKDQDLVSTKEIDKTKVSETTNTASESDLTTKDSTVKPDLNATHQVPLENVSVKETSQVISSTEKNAEAKNNAVTQDQGNAVVPGKAVVEENINTTENASQPEIQQ